MPFLRRLMRCALGLAVMLIASVGPTAGLTAAAQENSGVRRALLIGCSEYSGGIASLPGAANDVQRFATILTREFQFSDVRTLSAVAGPGRPTAAAIAAEFESLIGRTNAHDQIFILVSGHGTQIPVPESQVDLLDPINPEPDGFDEVFLAADYANGANVIKDDQFGVWLDQLRSKPASVWIVFDCCFSGTMTRGESSGQPIVRGLHPVDAGIPAATIQETLQRSESVSLSQRTAPATDHVVRTATTNTWGSLVAFYACQPFETAKEVYRPDEAARLDENRYGLLSYHLLHALRQHGEQLTYQDLARMIVSGIRAELGSQGPTPLFEGDVDQRVLGLEQWPQTSLYLEADGDEWIVSGGQLFGLAEGTVLSVHPPLTASSEDVLGYVQVAMVTTDSATVVPIQYGGQAEPALSDLPRPLRCAIVSGMAARSTSVGTVSLDAAGDATLKKLAGDIHAAVPERIDLVDASTADCVLTFATPTQALASFGVATPRPGYLLLEKQTRHATALTAASDGGKEWRMLSLVEASTDGNLESVRVQFLKDLQRVRAWGMLWGVANTFGDDSASGRRGRVSVRALDSSAADTPVAAGASLRPGTELQIFVDNRRYSPVWYSVFFLDAGYGIEFVKGGTIRARNAVGERAASVVVDRIRVNDSTVGIEGYIVLAVPLKGHKAEPNFRFLAQPAVGQPDSRSSVRIPSDPTIFEQVLLEAAQGRTTVRSGVSSDQAEMASVSWVTVPSDP